jgi:flagellar hook protein FlgE
MSMNVALSGLMAAQTEISATSHNIANVGTMGFRGSRVEFADVFHSSPYGTARTAVGSGTHVLRVAQDFSQGNVITTGNLLDIAIEGQGFFALQPMGDRNGTASAPVFSRSGAFSMNQDGYVVDSSNRAVMAWPVSAAGLPLTEDIRRAVPLRIPMETGEPEASKSFKVRMTLPTDAAMLGSQSAVPPAKAFDPKDATTFAHRTVLPAYDAEGRAIEADLFLVRTASPDATNPETVYEARFFVDGVEQDTGTGTPPEMVFDAAGKLTSGGTLTFGAGAGAKTMDVSGSALAATPFAVQEASHDGRTATRLTNLDVDSLGGVWATYGTGDRIALGQVVLASFSNPQGLRSLGKSAFAATAESGPILAGAPGTAGFGALRSGALERSNVELTEELVNLISAQRNYQASAKAMETSTSLMQTIMNIRS